MSLNIKVSGAWKNANPRVKVAGAWKNVTQAYVKVSGVWQPILGFVFSILNASYEDTTTISTPSDQIRSLLFRPDGTAIFALRGDRIYEYPLTTAWDVSSVNTSGGSNSGDLVTGYPNKYGMCWGDNGNSVIFVAQTAFFANASVYKFSLGTPYDISTINTTPTQDVDAFNLVSNGIPGGLEISADGTYYIIQASNNYYPGTMTTPWDFTTATNSGGEVLRDDLGTGNVSNGEVRFCDDGNKFAIPTGGNAIQIVELTTPYSLASFTVGDKLNRDINEDSISWTALVFGNGSRNFVVGGSTSMSQYRL